MAVKRNIRNIRKRDESFSVSVQEAVSDYLHSPHVKNLSSRTQEEYQQELGVFSEWCAAYELVQNERGKHRQSVPGSGIMLHQVNNHVVHLFLEHLRETHIPTRVSKKELSTYTLAGYVRVIKSFLNWCASDDQYSTHVRETIVKRIENPKVVETIIETFSPEQIQALFKACEKEESEHLQLRDKAILAVLLDCGLRATECITLTIGNVSLDTKDAYVRVLGKGKKWGEVGLGQQSRRYVQKYIRLYREPTIAFVISQQFRSSTDVVRKQKIAESMQDSLVFVNRYGEPLTKSGLWRAIDRLGDWAHIEGMKCSPHVFRHTFARMFMENGGDIYTLSKLLRHASVSITEDYLKSLQQSMARKKAKSVLDNL